MKIEKHVAAIFDKDALAMPKTIALLLFFGVAVVLTAQPYIISFWQDTMP